MKPGVISTDTGHHEPQLSRATDFVNQSDQL